MAAGFHSPGSACCWPLSDSVDPESRAAVHCEFISPTRTWRHNEEDLWLTSAHKQVWCCGFSLSLAHLAQALSGSPVASHALLSDAMNLFVLDIVLALITSCSNYSGTDPSLWKQGVNVSPPRCTSQLSYPSSSHLAAESGCANDTDPDPCRPPPSPSLPFHPRVSAHK